jgi:hypothetical protein
VVQALQPELLVQVQRNFAVGSGAQPVSPRRECPLDALEAVELAIHHDAGPLILAGDRLISSAEIDDAETRVP